MSPNLWAWPPVRSGSPLSFAQCPSGRTPVPADDSGRAAAEIVARAKQPPGGGTLHQRGRLQSPLSAPPGLSGGGGGAGGGRGPLQLGLSPAARHAGFPSAAAAQQALQQFFSPTHLLCSPPLPPLVAWELPGGIGGAPGAVFAPSLTAGAQLFPPLTTPLVAHQLTIDERVPPGGWQHLSKQVEMLR